MRVVLLQGTALFHSVKQMGSDGLLRGKRRPVGRDDRGGSGKVCTDADEGSSLTGDRPFSLCKAERNCRFVPQQKKAGRLAVMTLAAVGRSARMQIESRGEE